MSDTFTRAFDATMDQEGAYVNDPNDRGGETYRGIARRANPGWAGWPIVDALRGRPTFPDCLAEDIELARLVRECYRRLYWDRFQGDGIEHVGIAVEMFDTAVNMGVGVAVRFLQEALNALNRNGRTWPDVEVDGDLGPQTMTALREAVSRGDGAVVLKAMNVLQGAKYLAIARADSSQEMFMRGWLTRVHIVKT